MGFSVNFMTLNTKLETGNCRKPFKITVSYTVREPITDIYSPCDSSLSEKTEDEAFGGAEEKLNKSASRYCKKGVCSPRESCTPEVEEETIVYSTSEKIIENGDKTYKICYLTCTITAGGNCFCK